MRRGTLRRTLALARKELREVVRDPSSFGIAFVLPVLLLFLFGYGVSLDLDRLPIAVVADTTTPSITHTLSKLRGSAYIDPVRVTTVEEAQRLLASGEVLAIVRVRTDFPRRFHHAQAEGKVQVIVDGTDANTARLAMAYIENAIRHALARQNPPVIQIESRMWFNQEVESSYFLVPGTTAIILTILGAMLTALVVAKEFELGTMEKLQSSPLSPAELVLAKLLPYFALGCAGAAFTFFMAIVVFGIPFRGSYWVLAVASTLYLVTSLAGGLIISTIARSQFVSAEATLIVAFLPSFMLSGFVFEISSMPPVLQQVTRIIPPRYLVAVLQTVFLAGDVPEVILVNLAALAGFAVVSVTVAWVLVRRSLRGVA